MARCLALEFFIRESLLDFFSVRLIFCTHWRKPNAFQSGRGGSGGFFYLLSCRRRYFFMVLGPDAIFIIDVLSELLHFP